jgi:acyl-coenzyme A synthetase/AMP-(fatty) acid ligase
MVRLSLGAVVANARAIAKALDLGRDELAPTSLPLHYSYGLSVLNSHLVAGATVMLTDESLLSDPFWAACRAHGVTSLAGVPYSYQLLRRLDLAKLAPASLRTFTQAGGRLEPALVLHFHRLVTARGGRLFVMYGQTEATARITILSAADLPEHVGSVGRAIDGALEIADDGEVVYRGPNVMLGYAESRAELDAPDQLGGRLCTGDLGRLDEAGRLWITGRKKRIAKVFGNRLGLDELEAFLRATPEVTADAPADATADATPEATATLAAIADGDRVRVFVESTSPIPEKCATLRQRLAEHTGLHLSGFVVTAIPAIPRLLGGKIDYQRLETEKGS